MNDEIGSEPMLYFGYGSNLDQATYTSRVGVARVLSKPSRHYEGVLCPSVRPIRPYSCVYCF